MGSFSKFVNIGTDIIEEVSFVRLVFRNGFHCTPENEHIGIVQKSVHVSTVHLM